MATATTDAEIVNQALVAIGEGQFVNDLDEESQPARVAKVIFARTRDALLERFQWPFANKRATLAELSSPTTETAYARDGWDYTYALPGDCIAPRAITVTGVRAPPPADRIPFAVEADSTGGRGSINGMVLVTDLATAELVYTGRVSVSALFPPLFTDALVWRLAAQFALGIQKKPAVAMQMEQMFERALSIAAASAMRQGREDQPVDSEFISTRG